MSLKRRSYFAIKAQQCGPVSKKQLVKPMLYSLWPNIGFGGVLIANTTIDVATAIEINKLFCEVVIAPKYDKEGLQFEEKKTESF
jgi:phosphoribosylaminoimidazolecarboxamide formyltransferase/IMP cyclohydrolase